jgi:16S rRNA processing protein RimM
VRGELKCDPSNAGRTVFSPNAVLRCDRDGASSTIRIAGVRPHKGRLLLRIEGVEDMDAASAYAGATLYAARESIPLATGEYLDGDLVGCAVVGVDGTEYGPVASVEHYPASDMLLLGPGKMIPMVRAIVHEIDLASRRIVIDPPAGLLD